MKTLRTVEMYTKDEQERYFYDVEHNTLLSKADLQSSYELSDDKEIEFLQYLVNCMSINNGNIDAFVFLNNEFEMDYINEMLKDGIDLEECVNTVDFENCFEPTDRYYIDETNKAVAKMTDEQKKDFEELKKGITNLSEIMGIANLIVTELFN